MHDATDVDPEDGKPVRRLSDRYLARAGALVHFIDIGTPILERCLEPAEWEHAQRTLLMWRESVLNPVPMFANLRSLGSLENEVVSVWNELPLDDRVKEFWDRVEAAGLPYKRRDRVGEIPGRGRPR